MNLIVTVTRLSSVPLFVVLGAVAVGAYPTASAQAPGAADLARQVEVRRTDLWRPAHPGRESRGGHYALAYVQLEDYGARVAMGLLRARGEMGRWFGRDSMESDFGAQREYALAVENYPRLEQATRDVYEGFAAGVNRYIELHPKEFPAGLRAALHRVRRRGARRQIASLADDAAVPGARDAAGSRRGGPQAAAEPSNEERRGQAGRRSDRGGVERVGVRAEPHEVGARRSCCAIRTSRGAPATTRRT